MRIYEGIVVRRVLETTDEKILFFSARSPSFRAGRAHTARERLRLTFKEHGEGSARPWTDLKSAALIGLATLLRSAAAPIRAKIIEIIRRMVPRAESRRGRLGDPRFALVPPVRRTSGLPSSLLYETPSAAIKRRAIYITSSPLKYHCRLMTVIIII